MIRIIILLFFFILTSCDRDMHREKLVAPIKRIKDKVIAKVNGIPITLSDYYREERNLPEDLRQLLKDNSKKRQFIENLITKELLYQEAKKNNLDKKQNIKELINDYKKNLIINEFIKMKIKNSVKVEDKEAYDFYLKNKNNFYSPDKVEFEKFYFKDYTDAVNFLKNNTLDQCYSKCFSEKVSLIEINKLSNDIMFELSKLKKGEYSQNILFTNKGYVVLKLIKKSKGRLMPFYKVKNEIFNELKKAKEKIALNKYIQTLKSSSRIEIYCLNDNKSLKETP